MWVLGASTMKNLTALTGKENGFRLWKPYENGGGGRDRTGVYGFAGRCITTLLPRHGSVF